MQTFRRVLRSSLLRTPARFSGAPVHPPYTSLDLNGEADVFNFSAESERQIEVWLQKYPTNYKKSALIPLLFIAQKQNNNFVSLGAMNKIAQILEIPPIDVYEVASFYTMFNRTKVGRFHLQVCGTTPCMVCGAERIIKVLEKHLGIHVGETTQDMMFTLSEVECLGACVNAPMLQINNEWVYEDLTEENVIELIEKLKRGEEVKKGPQNHRVNSEGPLGRSSLKDVQGLIGEQLVHSRDFGKAKEDWLKAKEAAEKAAAEKAAADKAAKEKAEAEKKAQVAPAPLEAPKDAKTVAPGISVNQASSPTTTAASSNASAAPTPSPVQADKKEEARIQSEKEEKARVEKANQEKLEREKAEKEHAEKELAEKKRVEEELAEKKRAERELAEKLWAEEELAEKKRDEEERAEMKRADEELAKKMRADDDFYRKRKAHMDELNAHAIEQLRLEKERIAVVKVENMKLIAIHQALRNERMEKERIEQARVAELKAQEEAALRLKIKAEKRQKAYAEAAAKKKAAKEAAKEAASAGTDGAKKGK